MGRPVCETLEPRVLLDGVTSSPPHDPPPSPANAYSIASPLLMGDANGDGIVEDNDLALLLANWAKDAEWGHGEFNGEAPVDDSDLSLLLANWGRRSYSPTDAPEILAALNAAGSRDVVYLPAGTWDIGAVGDMQPTGPATIIGSGVDDCVLLGRLRANFKGASSQANWSGFTIDAEGQDEFTLGHVEMREGRFLLRNVRFTNASVKFVTLNGNPILATAEYCEFDNSPEDCVSALGGGPGGVNSLVTLNNCYVHDCGDGVSDQLVTNHNDVEMIVNDSTLDSPGLHNLAAQNADRVNDILRLRRCTIIGRVIATEVTRCRIDVNGATAGVKVWGDGAEAIGNKIWGGTGTDKHADYLLRYWGPSAATSVTIESNWLIGGGPTTSMMGIRIVGLGTSSRIIGNRIEGCERSIEARATKAVAVHNNVTEPAGIGTAYDILCDAGEETGGHNFWSAGRVNGYTIRPNDITSATPEFDADGTPTVGGNCDGTGDPFVVYSDALDFLGNPRFHGDGSVSLGPAE